MSPKYVSNGGNWVLADVKVDEKGVKAEIKEKKDKKEVELTTSTTAEVDSVEVENLDITGDGVVDAKDYAKAGKVLASAKKSKSKKSKSK